MDQEFVVMSMCMNSWCTSLSRFINHYTWWQKMDPFAKLDMFSI